MSQEFENEIVIIDDWFHDDTYDGSYPEGAREKNSYFSPSVRCHEYIIPDWRYLFKLSRSDEWCPSQFWMEVIAYRFGQVIGIKVPSAWPSINNNYETGKKTYGALIEWFYNEKSTGYYPGGQIMTQLIDDYDRDKGTKHNWMSLIKGHDILFDKIEDFMDHWARIFTFDTLIDNTDRHHDNWGIIDSGDVISFSPAFDNGTALGYEIQEKKLNGYLLDNNKLEKYIKKGHHHMKWTLEKDISDNYFSFMKKFVDQNEDMISIISRCLSFYREELEKVFYPLCDLVSDNYRLSYERVAFIIELIMARKKFLEETLEL